MPQPTMLIVEDEALILMCAVDFAEEAGYAALEAKDAGEAIEILERREEIEILFTDITLPGGLDGLQLADRVRLRWPRVQILLASGALAGLPADVSPGAFRLPKPYDIAQFLGTIERMKAVAGSI